jgi:hypothetical protein
MENTTTQNASPTLVQHAIKFGGILGGVGVALTLVLYAINYSLLADWKVGIFMILLFLGLLIYAGINYRNEIGGYLSYGKAFQHGILVLAISGLINLIFNGILYNVIDPELPQKLTDVTIEKTTEMMQGFGAPEDKIDEATEQMKVDMPARYTFVGLIKGYFWALIIYVIVSAVSSLIVRKNQPELI